MAPFFDAQTRWAEVFFALVCASKITNTSRPLRSHTPLHDVFSSFVPLFEITANKRGQENAHFTTSTRLKKGHKSGPFLMSSMRFLAVKWGFKARHRGDDHAYSVT